MLVDGAIVPPRAVLEEIVAVVQSVRREVESEAEPEPAARRLFGRHKDGEPAPVVEPPVLVDIPVALMQIPITEFGNVTANDAHRLAEAIANAAADWTAPQVRFAGGTALDFPGDPCVWAKLDGDVDALRAIARGVTQSVERLGFFVDRRLFRPMLSLATVTESTTGPDLDAVVGALDAFRGQEWTVDCVVLTTDSFTGDGSEVREFRRISIG